MVSTFTPSIGLEKPANGDYVDTWSTPVNADWDIIDTCFGGVTSVNVTSMTGTTLLSTAQIRPRIFRFTGTLTANLTFQIPSGVGGVWFMSNTTTGAFTIVISSPSGGTSVTLPQGFSTPLIADSTGIRVAVTQPSSVAAAGTEGQVQFNQGGSLGASGNLVWNPSVNELSAINIRAIFAFTGNLTGSVNGSVTGSSGSCTGNAATATVATTAISANTLFSGATVPESVVVGFPGPITPSALGFRGIPASVQGQGSTITLTLTDASRRVANTAGGWTIPANGSEAFPVDTTIVLHNNSGAGQTVSITTDTLTWAGTTSTGTRTVAANGLATLVKVGTTSWLISGTIS